MSTVSSSQSATTFAQPGRHHLWLAAAISPLLIASIGFALPWVLIGPLSNLNGLILLLLLAASTVSDLSQRKIFNWTTYPAFVWAIAINLLPNSWSTGAVGLSNSLYGAGACFAVMLIPYSMARGGAGDVKLATAIGALVGLDSGLLVIAYAYIIAAVTIALWTLWVSGPWNLLTAMYRCLGYRWFPQFVLPPTRQQSLLLDQPIPLAGFFAIASLLVVLDVAALLGSG